MPFVIKFIIALSSTFIFIAGTSLLWPKITDRSRPEALTQVRNMIFSTNLGKQAAQALGVEDEKEIVPVNVPSVAGAAISSVAAEVRQKAADTVTREILIQIVKKIETLNPDQQETIKNQICK